jgi:hypothetical protein
MNTALLSEERLHEPLQQCWTEWSKQTKNHTTMVMWWERVAKMRIKKLFSREGTVKRREETPMENFVTPVFMTYCSARSNTRKREQRLIILKPKL